MQTEAGEGADVPPSRSDVRSEGAGTTAQEARRLLDVVAAEAAGGRLPLATSRVQLFRGFDFRKAAEVVPYLADLGISDLYSSPILRASPGSSHCYDVLDHTQLNPELGGRSAFDALAEAPRGR